MTHPYPTTMTETFAYDGDGYVETTCRVDNGDGYYWVPYALNLRHAEILALRERIGGGTIVTFTDGTEICVSAPMDALRDAETQARLTL